jgi:hypothetical protein
MRSPHSVDPICKFLFRPIIALIAFFCFDLPAIFMENINLSSCGEKLLLKIYLNINIFELAC